MSPEEVSRLLRELLESTDPGRIKEIAGKLESLEGWTLAGLPLPEAVRALASWRLDMVETGAAFAGTKEEKEELITVENLRRIAGMSSAGYADVVRKVVTNFDEVVSSLASYYAARILSRGDERELGELRGVSGVTVAGVPVSEAAEAILWLRELHRRVSGEVPEPPAETRGEARESPEHARTVEQRLARAAELLDKARGILGLAGDPKAGTLRSLGVDVDGFLRSLAAYYLALAYNELFAGLRSSDPEELRRYASRVESLWSRYGELAELEVSGRKFGDLVAEALRVLREGATTLGSVRRILEEVEAELRKGIGADLAKLARLLEENRELLSRTVDFQKLVEAVEEFSRRVKGIRELLSKLSEAGYAGVTDANLGALLELLDHLSRGDLEAALGLCSSSEGRELEGVTYGGAKVCSIVSELKSARDSIASAGFSGFTLDQLPAFRELGERLEQGDYRGASELAKTRLPSVTYRGVHLADLLEAVHRVNDELKRRRFEVLVQLLREEAGGGGGGELSGVLTEVKEVGTPAGELPADYGPISALLYGRRYPTDALKRAAETLEKTGDPAFVALAVAARAYVSFAEDPEVARSLVLAAAVRRLSAGLVRNAVELIALLESEGLVEPGAARAIMGLYSATDLGSYISAAKAALSHPLLSQLLTRENVANAALGFVREKLERGNLEGALADIERISSELGPTQLLEETGRRLRYIVYVSRTVDQLSRSATSLADEMLRRGDDLGGLSQLVDGYRATLGAIDSMISKLESDARGAPEDLRRFIEGCVSHLRAARAALRAAAGYCSFAGEVRTILGTAFQGESALDVASSLAKASRSLWQAIERAREGLRELSDPRLDKLRSTLSAVYSNYTRLPATLDILSHFYARLAQLYATVQDHAEEAWTWRQQIYSDTLNLLNALESIRMAADEWERSGAPGAREFAENLRRLYSEAYRSLGELFTAGCEANAGFCWVGKQINENTRYRIDFRAPEGWEELVHRGVTAFKESAKRLRELVNANPLLVPLSVNQTLWAGLASILTIPLMPSRFAKELTEGLALVWDAIVKLFTGRASEVIEGVKRWWSELVAAVTRDPLFTVPYLVGSIAGAIIIAVVVKALVAKLAGVLSKVSAKVAAHLPKITDYAVNLAQADPFGLSLVFVSDMGKLFVKAFRAGFAAGVKHLSDAGALNDIIGRAKASVLEGVELNAKVIKRFLKERFESVVRLAEELKGRMAGVGTELPELRVGAVASVEDVLELRRILRTPIEKVAAGSLELEAPAPARVVAEVQAPIAEVRTRVSAPTLAQEVEEALESAARAKLAAAQELRPPTTERGALVNVMGIEKMLDELRRLASKYVSGFEGSPLAKLHDALSEAARRVGDLPEEPVFIGRILDELKKALSAANVEGLPEIIRIYLGELGDTLASLSSKLADYTAKLDAFEAARRKGAPIDVLENLGRAVDSSFYELLDTFGRFRSIFLWLLDHYRFHLGDMIAKTPGFQEVSEALRWGLTATEHLVVRIDPKDLRKVAVSLVEDYADRLSKLGYSNAAKALRDLLDPSVGLTRDPLRLVNRAREVIRLMLSDPVGTDVALDFTAKWFQIINSLAWEAAGRVKGATLIRAAVAPGAGLDVIVAHVGDLLESLRHADVRVVVPTRLIQTIDELVRFMKANNLAGWEILEDASRKLVGGVATVDDLESLIKLLTSYRVPHAELLSRLKEVISSFEDAELMSGGARIKSAGLKSLSLALLTELDRLAELPAEGFGLLGYSIRGGTLYTNITDPKLIRHLEDILAFPRKEFVVEVPGVGRLSVLREVLTDLPGRRLTFRFTFTLPDGSTGTLVIMNATEPPSLWRALASSVHDLLSRLTGRREGRWLFWNATMFYFDPETSVSLLRTFGGLDEAAIAIMRSIPEIEALSRVFVAPNPTEAALGLLKAGILAGALAGLASLALKEGLSAQALASRIEGVLGLDSRLASVAAEVATLARKLSEELRVDEYLVAHALSTVASLPLVPELARILDRLALVDPLLEELRAWSRAWDEILREASRLLRERPELLLHSTARAALLDPSVLEALPPPARLQLLNELLAHLGLSAIPEEQLQRVLPLLKDLPRLYPLAMKHVALTRPELAPLLSAAQLKQLMLELEQLRLDLLKRLRALGVELELKQVQLPKLATVPQLEQVVPAPQLPKIHIPPPGTPPVAVVPPAGPPPWLPPPIGLAGRYGGRVGELLARYRRERLGVYA